MRLFTFLLIVALAFPTFADAKRIIKRDADEETLDDEDDAPKAKKAPVKQGIPLDGLWRSDAALGEAEKLIKEKKYVDALTLLDQAVARNPRNTDAHVDSAVAWLNLGNLGKAKASIGNALAIDQAHMGSYVISGLIALMEKNTQQADYYLGALRMLCRGTSCPEYQTLQRIMREAAAPPAE